MEMTVLEHVAISHDYAHKEKLKMMMEQVLILLFLIKIQPS